MSLVLRAGLLSLSLALLGTGVAAGQRATRLANKAFELGDFAEAVTLYERALGKDPDDADARFRRAYGLRVLGRLEEATAELRALRGSEDPEVAYRLAQVLMERGRYPQAVEALFDAAQRHHPHADALAARLEYAQAHADDAPTWRVTNEPINTPGDDFAPETSGAFVVYASVRDGNPLELYRAPRGSDDELRVPTRLHAVGPPPGGDAPLSYSPSGELVALTRHNFAPGERLIPEAGWELSVALALPTENGDFLPGKAFAHNGPGASTGFPSFSADGRRLYFASDRPGGMGGYDIYYSTWTGATWGAPVNAGPTVNTPGHEIAPHASSGALYFASDYLPGFGGMDLYRADPVGDSFGAVANLGPGVNSPLDDVGFALAESGQTAYFASNRAGGKGLLDLYRAERTGQAVTIAVVDGRTGAPIPNAVLDFSDCGQGKFLTGADGAYSFRALPSLRCRPTVVKSGYNGKEFSIDGERLALRPRMEVVLNAEDKITVYEGKVIHSRTGEPIPGAIVIARHKGKDFTADAATDLDGDYTLSLERDGEYVIEYQAPGMAEIDREISTYDGDGAGVLSTFALFPDAGGAQPTVPRREMTTGEASDAAPVARPRVPAPAPPPAPAPTAPAEATTSAPVPAPAPAPAPRPAVVDAPVPAPSSAPTARPVPAPTPAPAPRPARPVATRSAAPRTSSRIGRGFAVQVAALRGDEDDISRYRQRLGHIGEVYGKPEGGMVKVRIGLFPTREAAAAALPEARAAGFGDAWIANEGGGPVLDASAAAPAPRSVSADASAPAAPYLIRLATYRSLASFDEAKAAALGTLTTRRRGEFVIVLLSGYESAEAARARLKRVREAGYLDAYVVREEGERLRRVE